MRTLLLNLWALHQKDTRQQKLEKSHQENSKETTITSDNESQGIVTASKDTKSVGDTERQDGAYAGKKQASGCIERRDTDLA